MPKPTRAVRPSSSRRPLNKLLASLPQEDFDRLRPHLRTVTVTAKHLFYSTDERIQAVVFPNGGVASMTTVMKSGATVENATVGDEGMVGIEVFFGDDVARATAMMQVPDTNAELLPTKVFHAEMKRRGALFEAVQRYSRGYLTLSMQSTACMAFHTVEERCCRWLLMTHDRVHRDDFQLSQEFLAMMLGVARPTVNLVASTLQTAGLITYRHSRITIRNRQGLEDAACECYATVKADFARLRL